MADFRLRIEFAKTGAAIWLSHLEVVRAMERCIRRSGLPYAISQGFSPHLKHSFSAALPVGTGSTGELMDVDIESLVAPEEALSALKAVSLDDLPVLSARYVPKDEPSLQAYFNHATYRVEIEDPAGTVVPELFKRLQKQNTITVLKKNKPKAYDLSHYVEKVWVDSETPGTLCFSLLSRPEGSLRPEVILRALIEPAPLPEITALTRVGLDHKDLA